MTRVRLTLTLSALIVCCGEADPNPRLEAAIADFCAMDVGCGSHSWLTVEQCVNDQNLILSLSHRVHGARCVDAYIEMAECQGSYDCDLYEALSRCQVQAQCDRGDPCAHLRGSTEQACGLLEVDSGGGMNATG